VFCNVGLARPASFFLVLAHKKETKEKGTPCHAPSGFPALLAMPGGCATRPDKPHKARLVAELRQCSPTSSGLTVLLGVAAGDFAVTPPSSTFRRRAESKIIAKLTP